MMGVCFDCLVTIDGVGNRQACLIPVRAGMRVVPVPETRLVLQADRKGYFPLIKGR
jgi:hypothetical protein